MLPADPTLLVNILAPEIKPMTIDDRFTTIYIQAAKGSARAARSVASKALHTVKPASMNFMGARAAAREGLSGARYTAYMTREQYAAFLAEADKLARADGFDVTPLDCYQD